MSYLHATLGFLRIFTLARSHAIILRLLEILLYDQGLCFHLSIGIKHNYTEVENEYIKKVHHPQSSYFFLT